MSLALDVSHVDQIFRAGFWLSRVQVLHDVVLKVPEGSIFGFLGANGAGKTTLIHLITGLRKPTRGKVQVFGLNAASKEAKANIGYLPERPYFHQHLTGDELLHYFGALSGLTRTSIRDRIPGVLSAVGLTAARRVELKRYSKGMLQRIGIAQALLHDPRLLVLDEPMSGLDPLGRKEMRELILRLSSEGRTLFFSTHVIPDVESICDQVALIQHGKLIGSGPIGHFLKSDKSTTEVTFLAEGNSDFLSWPEFENIRPMAEGFRGTVGSQESLDRVLMRLLSQKGKIVSVSPVRPSLEDLFKS